VAIAKWLAVFSENYRQPVGEMLPDIWRLSLERRSISVDRFERSCLRHLETERRFFPTIADVLALDAELRREEPVTVGRLTSSERKVYALYDALHAKENPSLTEGENDDTTSGSDERQKRLS
jgi:hypothetical protein